MPTDKVQLNRKVSPLCLQQLSECAFRLDKKTGLTLEIAVGRLHEAVTTNRETPQGLILKLDEILARVAELGETPP